ncbi:MAG TPA: type II toxin-antitoxin system death-on-curing family toxin [Caulobacteraceae bacterium]
MTVWVDEREALAIHERMLVQHGGALGVRDPGSLASALARPGQIAAYREDADLIDLAAAYTVGVVRNHPFVDGNKRTGFLLGVLFLELNGATFGADEAAATQAVMGLAAGTLDEAGYAAFLRATSSQPEQP